MAANIDLSERQLDGLLCCTSFMILGRSVQSDHILTKPEQLSEKEKKEIERHCEIGYRIAQSIPGLSSIAELILKHHEW